MLERHIGLGRHVCRHDLIFEQKPSEARTSGLRLETHGTYKLLG